MKKKPLTVLARNNGLNYFTVHRRIARGMDKIDALLYAPNESNKSRKITNQQIIGCERLGLSVSRSAYLLGVTKSCLSKRIKRMKISWRGMGSCNANSTEGNHD